MNALELLISAYKVIKCKFHTFFIFISTFIALRMIVHLTLNYPELKDTENHFYYYYSEEILINLMACIFFFKYADEIENDLSK
jgi:hypothetical protein